MPSLLTTNIVGSNIIWATYALVFGLSAIGCFGSLFRIQQIQNDDTRRGLTALLVTSGLWGTFHVAYFLAPTARLQYGFYVAGLVVGLSTVGPWLYFCSAYTGRTHHRNTTYQGIAIVFFLGITVVKVTNSIHQIYFSAEIASTPFRHLSVTHHALHWFTMALSYSLALVGIFMLFELFTQINYNTTPFVILVGLTSLPVGFDILGLVTPQFIDITHGSVGVAAFAVGVLFIYADQFQEIQVAGQYSEPVVVLDNDGKLRDYNQRAEQLFPELSTTYGEELSTVLPHVASCIETDQLLKLIQDGETEYYDVSRSPFSTNNAQLGQVIIFADMTEREQYRLKLERQNERLNQFTSMVSHDLRNPLNVAQGNLELASERDSTDPLDTVAKAHDRMEILIEDLLELARQGEPIDDTEAVSLAPIATSCWKMVDNPDAELVVRDGCGFEADPDRLSQLFENLFRNAIEHGGEDVTITVGCLDSDNGFFVEDTGSGIPEEKQEDVFEAGYTSSEAGTGFGLSITKEIVDAHDWLISVTNGTKGGARFEIRNVDFVD